jgi:cell division protein FtsX
VIASLGWRLRRSARIAIDEPRTTAWTFAAMTTAMFALGLVALGAERLAGWTAASRGGASMVVYLGSVDESHARSLASELSALTGVERVDYVAPAESARRLERALGGDETLLEGVDRASLPASLELALAPGVADVVAMSPTMRALRDTAGVTDVVMEDAGTSGSSNTFDVIVTGARVLAMIVAGLAALVVVAGLRVRFAGKRREHEVLALLGAGPAFTLLPTAIAGSVLATLASLIAGGAVAIVAGTLGAQVVRAVGGAFGSVDVAAPTAGELTIFIALGALLGMLGGVLAGTARATR